MLNEEATEPGTAPFDPTDFVLGEQRRANASVISAQGADPEKAARSLELAQATGDHPEIIFGNLENYEEQHKAALTNQLLSNNKFLADYVNSDSMAAKVSHDDFGQLDQVSDAVQKIGISSIASKAVEGFQEGFDLTGMRKEYQDLYNYVDSPLWRGLVHNSGVGGAAVALSGSMRAFTGLIQGAGAAIGETAVQLGASESWGKRLTRDMIQLAQVALSGQAGIHLHPEVMKQFQTITDATRAAKPYIEAGVEPPVGVHPEIDKLKADMAKSEMKNLDGAMKEAQASQTRERSPEMFASFIKQHTDSEIGISADAVREMYKDKQPDAEDGKLGWVPNLAEQLATAEATGGDIRIPLSDWLAKADPEIAKELHDDIRVRHDGLTLNEAKALPTYEARINYQPAVQIEDKIYTGGNHADALDRAAKALNIPYDELIRKYGGDVGVFDKLDGFVNEDGEFVSRSKAYAAVEAERSAAALKPLLEAPSKADLEAFFGGTEREFSPTARGVVPSELDLEPHEIEVMNKVNSVLDRIIPKGIKAVGTHDLTVEDRPVKGIYQQYSDKLPLIAYALDPDTSIITARHEAIHHLRQQGFFKPEEWEVLKKAAVDEDWLGKHKIRERYGKKYNAGSLLEEAIADEYARWSKAPEPNTPVGKVFEKLKEILNSIKAGLKEVFGHEPTAEEIFVRIESGEVGGREGAKPLHPKAFRAQAEELEPAERELFAKAKAVGMTADQYKRYQKLIDKRNAEDEAYQLKKAEEVERRKQTKEWKDNYKATRDEVQNDIEARPDIAAATFFTEGRVQDANLNRRPKLDVDSLTEEQKAGLPKEMYGKDGINPDDIAGMFGYQTGKTMVDRLVGIEQGRGEMPFKDYVRQLTDEETNRRMEKRFGNLEENILEEAKDHVISQTQMDLLHEETVALGMQAGSEMPFTQADFKSWVNDRFSGLRVAEVSTDRFLKEAGKAGREAELALLKGDPAEAFKQKQRQYLAMLLGNEAKKFEKDVAKFDKTAKKYAPRDVKGTAPEYTNFIQDLLMRVGKPVRRSIQDVQEAILKDGYKSLDEFNNSKSADLRDLHIPEFLLDPNFRKPMDELTTQEASQVHDAIKAMDFNGRNELKIEKAGEAHDLKEVLQQMKDQMATLGDKEYPIDRRPSKVIETGKSWWWSGITVESMLNRLDRDNPRGIFNQYIVRQFTEASNYKDKLLKEYQGRIAEVGKIENIDRKVENNLFVDPLTGEAFPMRRRNVLGILQNAGNANNLKKLAEGYGLKQEQVMEWLHQNTTKEDWDRAQKIGDIFNDIFKLADDMSHRTSGVGIQKLELAPVTTPFGTYQGWYNPIKYDPLRPGKSKALLGPNVPEAEGYYRATTPQGYTNQRTGYIAPVELNMDIVPIRMTQMLHDIAVRPAVLEMSKVFYNPEFKKSMIKHFGQHQAEEMIPFLRDFANSSNFQSMSEYMGNSALEFFRQNTIGTLIGYNPSTVMKHGPTALINSLSEVGVVNFSRELNSLLSDDGSGKRNWTMAMEKSEELQRRMRNYSELISGHGSEINLKGAGTKFGDFREFMMHAGATPVSISDLLSAVPTWLAKYKDEIAKGSNEGDAKFLADRAVRRAHGSSVLSNKPSIARTNALGAMFSSLYGFFSHMQQKQYELAWKAKDMMSDALGKGSGDIDPTTRHVPDLIKGLFSYIIAPAVIEELVTPTDDHGQKHSFGRKAAETLAMGVSSSFIGVRDFVRAVINVRDPQAGLIGTSLKAGTDIARDLRKGPQAVSKENAGNILKHTFALTGVLTGLTNAQEGRSAEYLWRYYHGQERPKGPWDISTGLRYGKTDKHSRTFEEWLKHH